MKKESGCKWRPIVGVLAIGVLAFGLSLQGAALHKGGAVSSEGAVATAVVGNAATSEAPPSAKLGPMAANDVSAQPAEAIYRSGGLAIGYGGDGSAASEGGLRADQCSGTPDAVGADSCELAVSMTLATRSCSVSGTPCFEDTDCTGGADVCTVAQIKYASGDVSLATYIGACSTSGLPCEYNEDCAQGTCSTSGVPCTDVGDCTGGPADVCNHPDVCDQNLPCAVDHSKRCDTAGTACADDGDCPSGEVCGHGDRGYFNSFVLTECSNVAISDCCGDATGGYDPDFIYVVMYTEASCTGGNCTVEYRNDRVARGGDPGYLCENATGITVYYDGLPPGTYYHPVYSAIDFGEDATYWYRYDATAAQGACCSDPLFTTCTVTDPCGCAGGNGIYLGDGTECGPPNPCTEPGSCCLTNGIGCTNNMTAGDCVLAGGTPGGPGSSCGIGEAAGGDACCRVPMTGADNCANAIPKAIPVPGFATFFGDSSTATDTCGLAAGTAVWFESFILDDCANIKIDYCCTQTGYSTVYWVMLGDNDPNCCDANNTIFRDRWSVSYGGTIPDCSYDGNFQMEFDHVPPGQYYITLYAGEATGLRGEYFVHVTANALPANELAACCIGATCVENTCQEECVDLGGTWLSGTTSCGPPNPCLAGACCEPDGDCTDATSNGCVAPNIHHPGIPCSTFRCPVWGADDCVNAQLITDCDGVALQGYNAHATARWGTCSISGAPCYTTDGRYPDHTTCPGGASDLCVRDAFGDPFYSCFWNTNFNSPGLNTVWYKFVAVESSIYVATCNSGVEDPGFFDSALVLYEGTCNGGLVEMTDPSEQYDGCGEDECPYEDPNAPWMSEICYCQLVIGQTYYLEVITALGTPGQYQLDLACPCIDCLPGACCETLGNRCFDYYEGNPENYEPVPGSVECTSDAECVGLYGAGKICLPYFSCTNATEPLDCPIDPEALAYRYGGNGTVCEIVEPGDIPIDPPCGKGACCYGGVCSSDTNPLECLGDIGQGDSWNGEGSTCLDPGGPLEDDECPKACTMAGYGHPNDGSLLYVSDVSSNGICRLNLTPCVIDDDCLGSDTCASGDTQAMADSFLATQTGVTELCWWGTFRDGDNVDCAADVDAQGTMKFDIVFWEDTDCNGLPDAVIAQYLKHTVTKSTTGMPGFISAEWEFHATFAQVALTPGKCYFLEIAAANSPDDCDFLWETSTVGDGTSVVDLNVVNGIWDGQANNDMAWLMDVPVGPIDCLPANDQCVDVVALGTVLSNGASVPFDTTTASTDGPAHPKATCGVPGLGNWRIGADIWYLYTAECSGTLTVDICTSGFDTGLAVYNYGSDPWVCPTLTVDPHLLGCNNDSAACGVGSVQSQIVKPVSQGDHILIRVGGNATAVGCGLLKVDLTLGPNGCFDDSDCPDDTLWCNGDEFCNAACECDHTGDPCDPLPCNEDDDTCGGDVGIDTAETCFDHGGGCPDQCLPLECDVDSPYDNVEPRLQLGVPPTVKLHCDGVPTGGTCTVTDCSYGGTCTVNTDATTTATVTFSTTLPNTECCTLTFTNGIDGVRTIIILEGDVNKDGAVNTADSSSVKARLGQSGAGANVPYDIDRDCSITTADQSSVKARLGAVGSAPCPCP